MNLNFKKQFGFALVEIIIYIALFAVMSIAVTNSLLVMIKSFALTAVQQDFLTTTSIMERMVREIRQASDVTLVSSTDIQLTGTNSPEFKLVGTNLQLVDTSGSCTSGQNCYLNTPNINITSLTFTLITTTQSKAVKIQMSVTDSKDRSGKTENFYNTVTLRGKY